MCSEGNSFPSFLQEDAPCTDEPTRDAFLSAAVSLKLPTTPSSRKTIQESTAIRWTANPGSEIRNAKETDSGVWECVMGDLSVGDCGKDGDQ